MQRKIIAIRKDNGNHYNPNEAISNFKYERQPDGSIFIATREEMVQWLDNGHEAYVSNRYGRQVFCYVNVSSRGTKFLQTYADGQPTNNLLELPEF